MDKNKFIVRYIPLEPFFTLLGELMKDGVKYIDLEGLIDPTKEQDIINVFISKDEHEPEELKKLPPKTNLTEDDINELI